jgi:hypothetical protein
MSLKYLQDLHYCEQRKNKNQYLLQRSVQNLVFLYFKRAFLFYLEYTTSERYTTNKCNSNSRKEGSYTNTLTSSCDVLSARQHQASKEPFTFSSRIGKKWDLWQNWSQVPEPVKKEKGAQCRASKVRNPSLSFRVKSGGVDEDGYRAYIISGSLLEIFPN